MFLSFLLLTAIPMAAPGPITRARYVMGTVCEITASSDREIEAAFAEAVRVEKALLSTWSNESELARLNARGKAQVSPELWKVLSAAREWSEKTDGAFNPLVRPLIDRWKTRGSGAVPEPDTLALARAQAAIGNLRFRPSRTIELSNGAAIEEGAFGKGYALDRVLSLFSDGSAAVLNFGGQLSVKGRATVTVADPERRDHPIAEFTLANASLSTSSGSEKSFLVGGRRFSHILDPRSGEALPPRGSVSVIADSGLEADILSTALYVMGSTDGLLWCEEHQVAAMFINTDKSIQFSRQFRRTAGGLAILDPHFQIKERHE